MVNPFIWKRRLLLQLRSQLSGQAIDKGKSDSHAKRRVRPCGLTVHPGRGCPYGCVYCYVQDLGLDFRETHPSRLSGEELVFSLLSNPSFIPGRMGTFLAFGSVCDPFYPSCVDKIMDFLEAISEYLGNPCQFSTKMYLSKDIVGRLSRIEGLSLSPLVSVTTLEYARVLEPQAPSPEKRMKSISHLKEVGFKPLLFLRPIIPGVTDQEFNSVLRWAKESGAVGVVLGSLKISQNILNRLEQVGVNLEPIVRKRGISLNGDERFSLTMGDFKTIAVHVAEEMGLIPFLSACCANAFTAGVPCTSLCWNTRFCTQCPNNCPQKIPDIHEEEVSHMVRLILGAEPERVQINKHTVTLYLPDWLKNKNLRKYCSALQVIARKRVKIA